MNETLKLFNAESLKKESVVSLTLYRVLKGIVNQGFDLYTDSQGRITLIRRIQKPNQN
ncbi:MAG: hypothetical protein H3C43_04770 [Leptonema sp. (in: Bacteria)]|nr:hypothetical protein [Leptonema sp. (in: bacteria)]